MDDFWKDFYERELLQWLFPDGPAKYIKDLESTVSRQRAIVVTGGGISFHRVAFLLKSLRSLNCAGDVPIEVYHCEKDPFDELQMEWLRQQGTAPVLINTLFSTHPEWFDITPETLKLYASLASRHREIIALDTDVVLFSCPLQYFEADEYKKTGALFFRDRELHPNNDALLMFLLERLFPQPVSPPLAHSAVFAKRSSFQHDSALVVVNKSNGGWLGLVAAVAYSTDRVRQAWGYNFRGEKEAWWMGWETVGLPYAFEQFGPASIGFRYEQEGKPAVCGAKILHFVRDTRTGKKMAGWASGGVDRPDRDGSQSGFDTFDAVTEGNGPWTVGLCQIGRVFELREEDAFGLRDSLALIRPLYKADPLVVAAAAAAG